jgi:hypothetical protein
VKDLPASSRVAANDLRRAEHSISQATRDTAQFLVTTLDITRIHEFSPTVALGTVNATMSALGALVESQRQLAVRAHLSIERAATKLGLTVTDWGVGDPKGPYTLEPEVAEAS